MPVEIVIDTVRQAVDHLPALVAAHALYDAGKAGVTQGASAAAGWLRRVLSPAEQPKLDAVINAPESAVARSELGLAIARLMDANPSLLADLHGALAGARVGATGVQNIASGGKGGQQIGDRNTMTIN